MFFFSQISTKLFSLDMVSLSGTRKTVSLAGRTFSYLLKVDKISSLDNVSAHTDTHSSFDSFFLLTVFFS